MGGVSSGLSFPIRTTPFAALGGPRVLYLNLFYLYDKQQDSQDLLASSQENVFCGQKPSQCLGLGGLSRGAQAQDSFIQLQPEDPEPDQQNETDSRSHPLCYLPTSSHPSCSWENLKPNTKTHKICWAKIAGISQYVRARTINFLKLIFLSKATDSEKKQRPHTSQNNCMGLVWDSSEKET